MTTVTINGAALKKAVKRLHPAYEKRIIIPILANVLIEVTPASVALTMTNLDLEIQCELLAADDLCDADGSIKVTIPWVMLDGIAGIGAQRVKFDFGADKNGHAQAKITADDATISLNLLCPAEDFPTNEQRWVDFAKDATTTEISHSALNRLLKLSKHCISAEETRYYLNGIYLCSSPENTMRALATDGHRLARIDSEIPWAGPSVILPRHFVPGLLAETANGDNKPLVLSIGEKTGPAFTLQGDGWRYRGKCIDGTFPDYTKVIPSEIHREAPAIRATLCKAQLAKIGFISSERSRAVKLSGLEPGKGKLQIISPDNGSIEIPAQITGGETGFNLNYLLAQAAVTPTFSLVARNGSDPAKIIGEDTRAMWVLMPMRV